MELFILTETCYALAMTGRWDDAVAAASEVPPEMRGSRPVLSVLTGLVEVHLQRGHVAEARKLVSVFDHFEGSIDLQDRSCFAAARAALDHAEGRHASALEHAAEAVEGARAYGMGFQAAKQGFVWATEAALALGDVDRAGELLTMVDDLPPGLRPPFLEAHVHRFRARMTDDEAGYKAAAGGFREYNFPFWLAVAQLEHAEWLVGRGRPPEAELLLAEAREIFAGLEAAPWSERADRVAAADRVPA